MKLIDILVQELPKRGGWPEGANEAVQDDDGTVKFFDSHDLQFDGFARWCGAPREKFYCTSDHKIKGYPVASSNRKTIITREQYEAALKQLVWDGTGLPPVGVECEYMKHERDAVGTWWRGTVKYASDCTVVIKTNGCAGETVGHPVNFEFRPIRSERDEAVLQMLIDVKDITTEQAEALYDAGYRKLSD